MGLFIMSYKVLITSAGTGSRLKAHTSLRNKGLITLGLRPAICRIIDTFDPKIPLVIAVGYQKESLIEILNEMYQHRNIQFVIVDNFEGEGSGLGHTLLCCEPYLQCPFIFSPNDTIIGHDKVDLDPNFYGNWIGLYDNRDNKIDPSHYRCVEASENSVTSILPKGITTQHIYLGLCGIKDYRKFWNSMRDNKDAILEGESFGLNRLSNKSAVFISQWHDTGNINAIETAFKAYADTEHNILPKKEEAIWIDQGRCVKYHNDPNFISDRITRLKFLPDRLTPNILSVGESYFSYEFAQGRLLSQITDVKIFDNFLHQMKENLWQNTAEGCVRSNQIQEEFYYSKTKVRVNEYLHRFDQADNVEVINGVNVMAVKKALECIHWDAFYSKAIWSNFHGDLHGENVIYQSDKNSFMLLDWRQNFGKGNYEYGDLYYDLGKILHGLIVRHSMVKDDRYHVKNLRSGSVEIDIDTSNSFIELRENFYNWTREQSYDVQRVDFITALIFLNIAALHHYPYSKFLFILGQYLLNKVIKHDTDEHMSH